MALTPEEVRDVTFRRARWRRRGYDEDSVDAFLDYVCEELVRVRVDYGDLAHTSAENLRLRARLADLSGSDAADNQGSEPHAERAGRAH